MPSPDQIITINLTSAEWFALLLRLRFAEVPAPELFATDGAHEYFSAVHRMCAQLDRAADGPRELRVVQ